MDLAAVHEAQRSTYQLSAAQLGVWMAELLAPGTAYYNIGGYIEIHGPVDVALFGAALRRVVAECETLQVRFEEDENGPRQVVSGVPDWSLQFFDVSSETDPRRAAE